MMIQFCSIFGCVSLTIGDEWNLSMIKFFWSKLYKKSLMMSMRGSLEGTFLIITYCALEF